MRQNIFSQIESEVIMKIIEQEGPDTPILKEQYKNAVVSERRIFKQGYDVTFEIKSECCPLPDKRQRALGTVGAILSGLERGLGFILWVNGGYIHSFEAYTYNEDLPETIDFYRIF